MYDFAANAMDFASDEVSTGTTIMACEFNKGVIVAADSRTTMRTYVSSRLTDKLTKITDHIYCCRSGSAADTLAVTDAVKYQLGLLQMELGEPVSVKIAANDVKQICYNYRESLSAGMIIAGWDRKLGGQVYSIPLGGMVMRQKCCIGGSGSGFIYGFVDEHYRPDMSKEECIQFCLKAVSQAMWRDHSSGGVIRMGIITEEGVEKELFINDEVPKYNKFS
ncbi:proteasome subunit beta type-6 [Parasteatoda tepidariorum]|uniref:proteasome subunit beta type-6 n=1 Tax=Parasteatoda tepidariorum TaxID=114398 RepID=UPI00077FDED4|nr:proteasome subunit beta type-6 [Parasteatoda tepidariorum]